MINQVTKRKFTALSETYQQLVSNRPQAIAEIEFSELPERVYNSLALDGSTLRLKDVGDILLHDRIRTVHEIREIDAVKKLAQAAMYLFESHELEVSSSLIFRLHRILSNNFHHELSPEADPELINDFIHQLVSDYQRLDAYFIINIARFHAELLRSRPFGGISGRIARLITDEQLHLFGFPPIVIPAKSKFDYDAALMQYASNGDIDQLAKIFAMLLIESLHRRIAKLTAQNIISITDWAKRNHVAPQSAINKATRATIPAFRERGHWQIDAGFNV